MSGVIEKSFRYARWLRITMLILIVVSLSILIAGYKSGGWIVRLTLSGFVFLSAGALLEMMINRIELRSDGIFIITLFQKRFLAREDIASVTWARGSGISLKLKSGKWVKLPDLGQNSQGLTNSVRAWIKRS